MEPRKLGKLVADSFDDFYGGLALYAPILLVSVVPGIALQPFIGKAAAAADAVFGTLAYAALVFAIDARQRGEPAGVGDAFGRVPAVLPALILSELLVALFVCGGLLLLIVPGIIMGIRYGLTHLAVLLEGRSGRPALKRSAQLMVAHMGKVVGNTFVMGLITLALTLGVAIVIRLTGMPSLLAGGLTTASVKIIGGWGSVFAVMLYRDLAALHPEAAEAPVPVEPPPPAA